VLEPDEGKLSSPVLRGLGASKARDEVTSKLFDDGAYAHQNALQFLL
jgi:hypothetical protein